MKNALKYTLLLIVLLSGCTRKDNITETKVFANADALVADALTRVTEISPAELKSMMDSTSLILIDVRNENEHPGGFIPGSVNIPRGSLEFRIEKKEIWNKEEMPVPARSELIIVYCKAGNRSALAAETLQLLGYKQVRSLKGGWDAWHHEFHDLMDTKETEGGEKHAAEGGGC